MTARVVGYWIVTGLSALAFAFGGSADLGHSPELMGAMAHLGYPVYLATLLGFWKLSGALAIVWPRTPRLKEWAYAGMFFDLTGAAFSHASSGDPAGRVLTPLVLLALVLASWALRPESRILGRLLPRSSRGEFTPADLAAAKS
ncbi:MAG TPA: DoxX family protein [Polyangiaceae bacterium]|nr:DoxX family protein [Polyangiaceae bacterium]